jgi:16S rRNA (guanine966-N2)-methyltransferase
VADAGRVIAGSARGIRLRAPGPGTRPIADRVKQTLFAILEPELDGARVLDLFAGSGAGGIESLSRGAASATFVEKDPGAVAVIGANLRATDLAGEAATVVRWDVVRWLDEAGAEAAFDVVLVDPPYADTELLGRVLRLLGASDAPLATDARVVAKYFWRDRPPERVGMLAVERERRFGETALTFYRRGAGGTTPNEEGA